MKKYLKLEDLNPEVISLLRAKGVNLEGKGGRYLTWEPVEDTSLVGIYKVNDGSLYKAELTSEGKEKEAEIIVFAKAKKVVRK